jgi:hypothetical protein
MSGNVILRNEKETSRVAGTLYGLSNTAKFAACGRVCWDQVSTRGSGGDLTTGTIMLTLLIELHRHIIGPVSCTYVIDRLACADQRIDKVGLQRGRDNLSDFFDFVDAAWGIRTPGLTKGKAPYLQKQWLTVIAKILSDHTEFWRNNNELFVPLPLIREFQKVDPFDKAFGHLLNGTKSELELLYAMIIKILNKGKSKTVLVNRYAKQKARDDAQRSRA